MKRIKLILATVAALVVMMLAAVPALAQHYEWTDWEQWGDTDWWCSSLWSWDEEDGWDWVDWICWHPEHGFWHP